jgi:hypothetical protein
MKKSEKKEPEVTITPRMVEAGRLALFCRGFGEPGEEPDVLERAVCAVYEAMVKAKGRHSPS